MRCGRRSTGCVRKGSNRDDGDHGGLGGSAGDSGEVDGDGGDGERVAGGNDGGKGDAGVSGGARGGVGTRRARAAVRHAILSALFATLAMLPPAMWLAPQIKVPVRLAPQPAARARMVISRDSQGVAHTRFVRPEPQADQQGLWPATAVFAALGRRNGAVPDPGSSRVMGGKAAAKARVPWRQGQAMADQVSAEMGLRRRATVLLQEELAGPVTCGTLRPTILLPGDAENWNEADMERAMRHELEHVRRGDWATHTFARVVCAGYWFHPLAWIARGRMALEAERACDDAVVERSEATAYADQLLALARRMSSGPAKSAALGMASRADLAVRIGAVLNERQKRGRAARWQVALAGVVAAAGLAIAPVRVVAAPQAQTYEAAGQLVVEDVTVLDANGKTIDGLKASDFAVTEDGAPQTISIFEFQKVEDSRVSSYYLVGYYTKNTAWDGSFRRIKTTLTNGMTAKLTYRMGYYAGKVFGAAAAGQGGAGTQAAGSGGQTGAASSTRPGVFGGVGGGGGVFGGVSGGAGGGVASGVSGGAGRGVGGGEGSGSGRGAGGGHGGVARSDTDSAVDGVTEPIPLYKREPEYSEEARKAKLQGSVTLAITIDENGRVANAKVIRSLGLGLDEKAIEAVLGWRFRPGTKNGKAVSVLTSVYMDFRLL